LEFNFKKGVKGSNRIGIFAISENSDKKFANGDASKAP
jgi:hypothetical protein